MIRLLIADDHPIVRQGLRSLFESVPGVTVVDEIALGSVVAERALALWPAFDILMLDARMPGLDPIATVRQLCAAAPALKVVVLSSYDEPEYVTGLLNAGARGYILKDEPRATLVSALHVVADGEMYMSPKIASVYVRRQRRLTEERERLMALTDREREVLTLVGQGHDNQEVGAVLSISYETVKNHLRNIYTKLNLANRYQAIAFAFRTGLVAPE